MKNLIIIAALIFSTNALAYDNAYERAYYGGAYAPPSRYVPPTLPNYGVINNIPNPNWGQAAMNRMSEQLNRQLEMQNAIRNYDMIYGDTYRSPSLMQQEIDHRSATRRERYGY